MSAATLLVSLWDMLELKAGPFYQAVSVLQSASAVTEEHLKLAPDQLMPDETKSIVKVLVNDLLDATHVLGARVAEALTEQLHKNLDGNILHRTVAEAFGHIDRTLRVELGVVKLLVLDSNEAALYEPKERHFGTDVRNKFPHAIPEIDEAAKCLALGRSTATVFHLMRALELVLKAINACLGLVQPTDRNWTSWLAPIRQERIRRGGTKWAENDFFQDAWQRLDSIKDAQRNPTMHVESIYTGEEARLIFDNTGAFMKKIASRMDEQGLPFA